MPRPVKCRRVCHYPETQEFIPAEGAGKKLPVILTVDEYETIRLIDWEGRSQEECSAFMQIARTTVQRIYESARRKLAEVLVNGLPLRIEGGDFWLCDGRNSSCGQTQCIRRQYHQQYGLPKGEQVMRAAVTYENGQVFQHFGHTKQFKIYDVVDGKVNASVIIDTNGSGHGALAGMLSAMHVDTLICGGIGGGAQAALAAAGIRLFGGVSGSADEAVEALLKGNLAYDPEAKCDHHDHHHGEGHTCGDHGCGSHDDHHCGGHCH